MNLQKQGAIEVMMALEEAGYEAYMVGGCVRDEVLQKEVADYDLATSALPDAVRALFLQTIPVGLAHGTVIVRHRKQSYEVTTFRQEGPYLDQRRPSSVTFIATLEEDLSRRDFTMNAMAKDRHGKLYDFFGGKQDIADKIITTVGSPEARFEEDPLRMMRALRFSAVLGFTICEETQHALCAKKALLKRVSTERLAQEFIKLLGGQSAGEALRWLFTKDLVHDLPMGHMLQPRDDAFAIQWHEAETLQEQWALFLYEMGVTDATSFLKAWKQPNQVVKTVSKWLAFLHSGEALQTSSVLYQLGTGGAHACWRLQNIVRGRRSKERITELQEAIGALPIQSRQDLCLNGTDVAAWVEKEPGPWLHSLLTQIEEEVLAGRLVNERDRVKTWVKQWKENQ
ncbi:tRNA CCA-pyrophosphorylase [Fictibacillus macauensis ZFHKF-1]|uniref:tRNA CCA-pyrophosphorylase n=1 Tax=Fictibacillus macauensis ZFHKF-1 TaxID=1196324 RepID=I8UI97_9BACL|nr:CCA tRNA nucleotidyltransferase [Fictibacillus macauensis]EIT86615.1 tRNA CCA-pyrophosphorylase [Fictibacillus macauensis ZFHKF-1]